jgi:hypothetical protein
MWTSDPTRGQAPPKGRVLALEALALATAFALVPELPWLGPGRFVGPHPGWLAVLILSARYGSLGFFAGLAAAAAGVEVGSVLAGRGLAASWHRLDSAENVVTLGGCLLISWIASSHIRRRAELRERLTLLGERAARAEENARTMREIAASLRLRADRTSSSLEFLRDVAARIEGADPLDAAEAAADLALVRTGALAVAIASGEGDSRRIVAFRHTDESNALAPPDPRTADVAVPLHAGTDRVGSLEIWGIVKFRPDRALRHDLDVIASWCTPAVVRATWRQSPVAPRALEVS